MGGAWNAGLRLEWQWREKAVPLRIPFANPLCESPFAGHWLAAEDPTSLKLRRAGYRRSRGSWDREPVTRTTMARKSSPSANSLSPPIGLPTRTRLR
jgi:hypothetical protein